MCDTQGRVRASGPDVLTDACEHDCRFAIPDLRLQVLLFLFLCLILTPDPP
jgi:hypothetical protein